MNTTTDVDDVSTIIDAFETQLGNRTIPFAMIARFQVTEEVQSRVERAFAKAVPPTGTWRSGLPAAPRSGGHRRLRRLRMGPPN